MKTYTCEYNGSRWIDIPFMYDPFWYKDGIGQSPVDRVKPR